MSVNMKVTVPRGSPIEALEAEDSVTVIDDMGTMSIALPRELDFSGLREPVI